MVKYDVGTLRKKYGVVEDISGTLETLAKDSTNPNTFMQLAETLGRPQNFYHGLTNPTLTARQDGEVYRKTKLSDLEAYVTSNTDQILETFDDKKSLDLLLSLNLEKAGIPEYDEFVAAVQKQKEIMQLAEGQGDIETYLAKNLSSEEDWRQTAASILNVNESYKTALLQGYLARDSKKSSDVIKKYSPNFKEFVEITKRKAEEKGDKNFYLTMGKIAIAKKK